MTHDRPDELPRLPAPPLRHGPRPLRLVDAARARADRLAGRRAHRAVVVVGAAVLPARHDRASRSSRGRHDRCPIPTCGTSRCATTATASASSASCRRSTARLRASVAVNAAVAARYPCSSRRSPARGWEIVAHGSTWTTCTTAVCRRRRAGARRDEPRVAARATGQPVAAGSRPRKSESRTRSTSRRKRGSTTSATGSNDDLPYPLRTAAGRSTRCPSRPTSTTRDPASEPPLEDEFRDQSSTSSTCSTRRPATQGGRILAISLHPWIIGQPHRIGGSSARSRTSPGIPASGPRPAPRSSTPGGLSAPAQGAARRRPARTPRSRRRTRASGRSRRRRAAAARGRTPRRRTRARCRPAPPRAAATRSTVSSVPGLSVSSPRSRAQVASGSRTGTMPFCRQLL